jgi:hypothetical protein
MDGPAVGQQSGTGGILGGDAAGVVGQASVARLEHPARLVSVG